MFDFYQCLNLRILLIYDYGFNRVIIVFMVSDCVLSRFILFILDFVVVHFSRTLHLLVILKNLLCFCSILLLFLVIKMHNLNTIYQIQTR